MDIEDIQLVTITLFMDKQTFQFRINDLYFQPDICIVKEVNYSNSKQSSTKQPILIWCSLSNNIIATISSMDNNNGSTPIRNRDVSPKTIIMIKSPINVNLTFSIYNVSVDGKNTLTTPSAYHINAFAELTILLQFVKFKNNKIITNIHDQESFR